MTNFKTIKKSINRLNTLTKMAEDGTFDMLPKKEAAARQKEMADLERNYGGIKNMNDLPAAIFVVDTNCDPDDADYIIPGNDDAIRAIKLISSVLADAVIEGRQGAESADVEADAAETAEAEKTAAEAEAE